MNWIKSKVVMLPQTKSGLLLSPDRRMIFILEDDTPHTRHLYFTSDEPIKEGDWCINANNTIVQYKQSFRDKETLKKIIATTDKSLGLPEPSKEFLEVYVKAYNEGKKIEEVLIEYSDAWGEQLRTVYPDSREFYQPKLKVKPDNTITIKKVKDSWNREEVEQLLLKLDSENQYSPEDPCTFDINEWIKENLYL